MLPMTPLIDVVFLLLIFFLVAARLADEDREMEVQLPTASESKPLIAESRELFLHIDEHGQFFVTGQVVSAEQLEESLRNALREQPALETAILRADRRCAWDAVAQAINACHRVGLHDVRPTTSGEQP
jgi:biopolymer transport protein ExbD